MQGHATKLTLPIDGAFNMAVLQKEVMVFRTQEILTKGVYPEVRNRLFRVSGTECTELVDITNRPIFRNYTTGIEDMRIYTPYMGLGVVLDTNPDFRIEMCVIDIHDSHITGVHPISITDMPLQHAEKNWLLLKKIPNHANEWDCLYSLSPLCILRINTETANGRVLYRESFHLLEPHLSIHNGASVQLPDQQFLVTARVKDTSGYLYSIWVLLNRDYRVVRVSHPFRFFPANDFFEMCMSLVLEDSILHAFVSIDDHEIYRIEYPLQDILHLVHNMRCIKRY